MTVMQETQSRPRTATARRVLYLDHTARWSGGEIALFRFLSAIDRSRYEPVVVVGEEGELVTRLQALGIHAEVVPLDESARETRKDSLGAGGLVKKLLSAGPSLLAYARKVAAIARKNQCAIIHCNSLKSDIYGSIVGRMVRIPVIWHVRDNISPDYLPRITALGFRAMAKSLPTQVLCNSRSTLLTLLGKDAGTAENMDVPKRYAAALDCVDETFLRPSEPPLKKRWREPGDDRPIKIGIIGRLTHWKGQHIFLQAAKQLLDDKTGALPPLRFILAGGALFGEDSYEAQIKAQAKRDLPVDAVEWRGNIGNVPELLSELDILVHASVTPEPFGQVVAEGMAAGVPVIATRGGGVPEIITDGVSGLLTPMGDADALTAAIGTLLNDPERASRLAIAGWQEIKKRFLPERTASDIAAVYDNLLTRR